MIITAGRPGEQTLLVRAVDGILGTHSVTYDQEWTLTLTAAQVHATLALAAATAVGRVGPDCHAWADVAATRLSASKPEPTFGEVTRLLLNAPPAKAARML